MAGLGQHGLATVALAHLEAATLEKGNNVVVSGLAKRQLGVEEFADCGLGDIVSSRSQTARDKHQVGIHAGVEGIKDVFFSIANGQNRMKLETCSRELFAQPSGIGVNHLSDKQFVANGDILDYYFFHLA